MDDIELTKELKTHLDRGMRKRIAPLGAGNGNVTRGAMCFGYEKRGEFFDVARLVGSDMPHARQPADKPTTVSWMEEDDAVTIMSNLAIKFEHGLLNKLKPETIAEAMASGVVRDMLDIGIVCLHGTLGSTRSVYDHSDDVLRTSLLCDQKGTTSIAWIAHSTPLFDLIHNDPRYANFWKNTLYSFDNIGFIRELDLKPIIVRDSSTLEVNEDSEISKYRTIGLFRCGLAAHVDDAVFNLTNDTCELKWYLRIAIRGFKWKDNNTVNDTQQLSNSSNWHAKTKETERWAGFIIETKPPAGKQANAG